MDDNKYDRNMFGMVTNPDGSIKMCCGVIPMIALFIAAGAGIFQLIQHLA